MNKYKYVATDINGKKVKGTFVAESEAEMKEMLLKANYYVVSSKQVSDLNLSSLFSLTGKIKVTELSQFCNQFAVMIDAGISIVEAVDVCSNQNYSRLLINALNEIKDDLKQGVILSEAMAKHPKIFPPFFSSMVYVGESTGCLDKVLINVAEYYEFEYKTKKKVIGALAYPIILLVMTLAIIILMLLFVIPRFISSFSRMDIEMPAITMGLFRISQFFQEYGLIVLAIIVMIIVVMWLLSFLPSVKYYYDMLKVKLPLFKKINMALFSARLCRSLGLLLSSGSDSLSALLILKKTITNKYLEKQFNDVIDKVQMGLSLSAALSAEMAVSPILIQMIVIGEKTGELDKTLTRTAPYFASQAERSLETISTIIQPVLLILIGGAIAILFVAVYSPILEMIKQIQV